MPKGKKGGGKKGKKGGKKSKKAKEPGMTPAEAIWDYKIKLQERELEEIAFQVKGQLEMKERNQERNKRLAEEREAYMNMLLKRLQEQEKKDSEHFTDRPKVVAAMQENWRLEQQEREEIRSLRQEIEQTIADTAATRSEIETWREFRDRGQLEQQTSIRLLRQEVRDIDETFKSMCEYLDRKTRQDRDRIQTTTDTALEEQKSRATDTAVQQLDKNTKQELVDNSWLKEEAETHRAEMERVLAQVEDLERRNLRIMADLFECRVLASKGAIGGAGDSEDGASRQPRSASEKALEDRFLALTTRLQSASERGSGVGDRDDDAADSDAEDDIEAGDEELRQLLRELGDDGRSLGELMNVGPLEVKLLGVAGSAVRLHTPYVPTAEELEAKQWNPDVWPVNRRMLHSYRAGGGGDTG
uniref:Coiled-coil domain-containing protein 164 n=1 Tax=Macrostomum lignano TaxID=282301 RepID=A0A1I8JAX5_9PLAT